MQSDLPHTLYGKHGQEEGTIVTDDVVQKQLEANRRARERHARKKGVTLDELFKKDND